MLITRLHMMNSLRLQLQRVVKTNLSVFFYGTMT